MKLFGAKAMSRPWRIQIPPAITRRTPAARRMTPLKPIGLKSGEANSTVDKAGRGPDNLLPMTTNRLRAHSGAYARFFGFVYFGA